MTPTQNRASRAVSVALWRWLRALAIMALVSIAPAAQVAAAEMSALRPLPADFGSRKAVAYSPFRSAKNVAERDSETITAAMVQQDLELLVAGRFTLIRLFDSSDKVARLTLQVIRERRLDIKMMLGIYVVSGNAAHNDAEVARGIALARAYNDIVLAVSVGNETMVGWSFNRFDTAALLPYLETVRAAVAQPVTSDDNWAFYAHDGPREQDPASILASIDFVAMHTYPLLDTVYSPDRLDWRQGSVPPSRRAAAMVDAAVARAKFEYAAVRANMDRLGWKEMPIVIGETGWQAEPTMVPYRSHPVNQRMYVERIAAWEASQTGPRAIFYFEAFDEPWKERDDKWGLFNVERQARYVVQPLYPRSLWEPGTYSAADAVYVKPIRIRAVIEAPRYTVYADARTQREARPALGRWRAWEGESTAAVAELRTEPGARDPGRKVEIAPRPKPWGWGVTLPVPRDQADDLSAFAKGSLNFAIRTHYPGKLEVGFHIGSVTEGSAFVACLPIGSGEFGYANDGTWRSVSIPIEAIRRFAAEKNGVGDSKVDLMRVTGAIVIADRYGVTGKTTGSAVVDRIELDAIHWAK